MPAQCKIAREWAPWRNSLDGTENGQPWKTAMGLEVTGTAAELGEFADAVKSGDLAEVLKDRPAFPPAVALDFESALRKAARIGVEGIARTGSSQEEIDGAPRKIAGRVEVGLSWSITIPVSIPEPEPAPFVESDSPTP